VAADVAVDTGSEDNDDATTTETNTDLVVDILVGETAGALRLHRR